MPSEYEGGGEHWKQRSSPVWWSLKEGSSPAAQRGTPHCSSRAAHTLPVSQRKSPLRIGGEQRPIAGKWLPQANASWTNKGSFPGVLALHHIVSTLILSVKKCLSACKVYFLLRSVLGYLSEPRPWAWGQTVDIRVPVSPFPNIGKFLNLSVCPEWAWGTLRTTTVRVPAWQGG